MLKLLQPARLCGLDLKNRLFRSATWVGLCNPGGTLTPEIYRLYREVAQGGVGTIVTELTDVCERNNAIGNNMRLYSDRLVPDYRKLVGIAHESGAKIIPQLNMYQYVRSDAPDRIVNVDNLTFDDIADIEQLFVAAAVRAHACGFDAVQLHLAYGWLLYRFLSPYHNHRSDAYGGSPENRARIVAEIVQGIKAELPGFPVCAKFSFYMKPKDEIRALIEQSGRASGRGNGRGVLPFPTLYATDQCVEICAYLYANGLDFIEVLGDHSPVERGNDNPSCYLELAAAVWNVCDVPLVLTGCNNNPEDLEDIIDDYGIGFFALSRALIREPDLPARWTRGDLAPAKCIHCDRCYQTEAHRCRFN